MGSMVVHHGINKTAFELAGLFIGDSIWHNDGNVMVFVLIGPRERQNLCCRRGSLLHEFYEFCWNRLHRVIPPWESPRAFATVCNTRRAVWRRAVLSNGCRR